MVFSLCKEQGSFDEFLDFSIYCDFFFIVSIYTPSESKQLDTYGAPRTGIMGVLIVKNR